MDSSTTTTTQPRGCRSDVHPDVPWSVSGGGLSSISHRNGSPWTKSEEMSADVLNRISESHTGKRVVVVGSYDRVNAGLPDTHPGN